MSRRPSISPAEESRDFEWALEAANAVVEGSEVRCCGGQEVVSYLEELHDTLHPAEKKTCKDNASLPENCLRQVVISVERVHLTHDAVQTTYMRPTDCAHCNKMLMGLKHQGWKCKGCKKDFHNACLALCNCEAAGRPEHEKPPRPSNNARTLQPESFLLHNKEETTFRTPTDCSVCKKMLLGISKQGLKCMECELAFHKGDHPCSVPNQICPAKYLPVLSQAQQEEGAVGIRQLPGPEGLNHTLLGVVRLNLQDLTTEAARLAGESALTIRLETPPKDHHTAKFLSKGSVSGSVRLSASLQMTADPPGQGLTVSRERYQRYVQRIVGSSDWVFALQPATEPFSLLHVCSLRARLDQTMHILAVVKELMEVQARAGPEHMGEGGQLGAVALLLERLDGVVAESMRKTGRPDNSTLVQMGRVLQTVLEELGKMLKKYHTLSSVSSKFVFFLPTTQHAGRVNLDNRTILILNAKDSPLDASSRRMDDALSALKWVWRVEQTMGGLINVTQGRTMGDFVKTELTRLTNDLLTSQQAKTNQRGSMNNITLLDQLTQIVETVTDAVHTDTVYTEVIAAHTGGFEIERVTYEVAQKLDAWVRQTLRSFYSGESQDTETQELAVRGVRTPLDSPMFRLYFALRKLKDALLKAFIDMKVFYPAVETVLKVSSANMEKSVDLVMQANHALKVEFSDREFETRHATSAQDTFLTFSPLIDFINKIKWEDQNTLETLLVRYCMSVSSILIKFVTWMEGRVVELHKEQHDKEGRLVSAPLCVGMNTVQYVIVQLPKALDALDNKLPATVFGKVLEAIMTENMAALMQKEMGSPNEAMMRDTFTQTLTALLSTKRKFSNYIIYEYGNVMDDTFGKLLQLDATVGFGNIFGKAKQLLVRDKQTVEKASTHAGLVPASGGFGDSRFRASVMGRKNHTLPPKKQAQLDELIDFITEVLSFLAQLLDTTHPTWVRGDDLATELVEGLWDTNVDSMRLTIDGLRESKSRGVPTAEQYQWGHAIMHQLYELFNSNEDGVEGFPAKKLNSADFRELMAMLRRGLNPQQ